VAVACSAVSLALTFIAVVMHLSATCSVFLVGTKIEGLMSLLLIAFWISIVSVVTDPVNDLAVNENGAVSNGNLFYFSWAGLICSVILETSFMRDVHHLDFAGEIHQRAARLNYWSGLMLCCLVVMGTSSKSFHNNCKISYLGAAYCNRTVFAITLGTVGAVLSLYVVVMKIVTRRTFFVVEALFSLSLMLAWAFGVAFITAEAGPGAPLGNLYYFTWASFFLAFVLCSSLYEDYVGLKNPTQNASAGASNNDSRGQKLEDEI